VFLDTCFCRGSIVYEHWPTLLTLALKMEAIYVSESSATLLTFTWCKDPWVKLTSTLASNLFLILLLQSLKICNLWSDVGKVFCWSVSGLHCVYNDYHNPISIEVLPFVLSRIDPLLSSDSVNNDLFLAWLDKYVPIARQQVRNNATVELQQWNQSVSTWSVPRRYKQGTKSFVSHFSEERTWAREAEESPLLEAVVRGRMMKIQ
jgi:hypothetical protein